MADFQTAYKRTAGFEGGYVNDPQDKGGETYYGVARKANPNWNGWTVIDMQRNKPNFPKNLEDSTVKPRLQAMKASLFESNYWNLVWGDRIKVQEVANDMFDTAINMGTSTSIKLLERQYKLTETGKMSEQLLLELNKLQKLPKA
jgi:lysozyme family protein